MNSNFLKPRALAINEIYDVLQGKPHKDIEYKNKLIKTLIGIALRRLGEFQYYINNYIKKPLKKEHDLTKAILIIGITQILYMKHPDYASVNTCVEITKNIAPQHTKLVNGVLRNILRDIQTKKFKKAKPSHYVPDKISKRWNKHIKPKHIEEMMIQNIEMPPPLDISISSKENLHQWEKLLKGKIFGDNNIRILNPSGKIKDLHGYNDGKWWIQDYAAQLPAKILISALNNKSKIIDMCAAPGGKTAQLMDYFADVVSIEKNKLRGKILEENLNRLKLKKKIIIMDAINFKPKKLVDGILLDAPCSSTGTFRKNPDILWRIEYDKNFKDKLNSLCNSQKNLLASADNSLKPGGVLVYAVCSLELEEGEKQIFNFLDKYKNYIIKPVLPNEININENAITKDGFIKTFPYHYKLNGGIDGFFIARLVKKN